jgi:hypothetical protein
MAQSSRAATYSWSERAHTTHTHTQSIVPVTLSSTMGSHICSHQRHPQPPQPPQPPSTSLTPSTALTWSSFRLPKARKWHRRSTREPASHRVATSRTDTRASTESTSTSVSRVKTGEGAGPNPGPWGVARSEEGPGLTCPGPLIDTRRRRMLADASSRDRVALPPPPPPPPPSSDAAPSGPTWVVDADRPASQRLWGGRSEVRGDRGASAPPASCWARVRERRPEPEPEPEPDPGPSREKENARGPSSKAPVDSERMRGVWAAVRRPGVAATRGRGSNQKKVGEGCAQGS